MKYLPLIIVAFLLNAGAVASEIVSAPGAPDDAVTITYALWGGPGDVATARANATAFVSENPDVRVELAVYPWGQYWAKLQTQCAAGLAPDVISLYSVAMGVWIERGALLPLDGLIQTSGLDLDAYHATALDTCRWRGELAAFPIEMAVRLLAYDKRKLQQAGINPTEMPSSTDPMSWEAFQDLCARLTVRAADGSIVQYGAHYGYGWERSMLGLYGGTLVDAQTAPTRSTVRGDSALARALIEIYQQQYAARTMLGNIPLSAGLSSGADNALLSGRFAMGTTGSWALPGLQASGIELGLAPLPVGTAPCHRITVNALGIFADSPQPEAAWRFIRFMASQPVQERLGASLKGVPALKAASDAIIANEAGVPDGEAFLAAVERASPQIVAASTDVTAAIDTWFASLETRLDAAHDQALRALPRDGGGAGDGAIAESDYAAFEQLMRQTVAQEIRGALPALHADLTTAFARSREQSPGTTVRVVLPLVLVGILVALFVGLGWWLLRRRRRSDTPQPGLNRGPIAWLFLSPWLIGMMCFVIGPVLAALVLSFHEWNMISAPRWLGLAHYLDLAGDERFWIGLERTFLYAALVIPISLLGGLFTAGLLTCDIRGRDAFKAILYFPSLLTGAAAAVLWVDMFNKEYGIVNRILGWLGAPPVSWLDEQHAFFTVVLMNVFWIGGSMIIYYAGMKQIPKELHEAAEVDGAGPVRRFLFVTIPLLSPVILFLVVVTTIAAFQIFTPALFVAESSTTIGSPGDSLRFYSVNIYDEAFNNLRMGRACAQALILFVIIFLITMVQLRLSRRFVEGP